jgi:hypothetical protein
LTADSSPARKCGIDPRSSRFALDTAGRVNFWLNAVHLILPYF